MSAAKNDRPPASTDPTRERAADSIESQTSASEHTPDARFAVATIAILLGGYALLESRSMSRLGSVFPTSAGLVLVFGGLANVILGWRDRRRQTSRGRARGAAARASSSIRAAGGSHGRAVGEGSGDYSTSTDDGADRPLEVTAMPAVDPQRISWPRWIATVATLVAWALLLRPLGFLAASTLGMLALAVATGRDSLSFGRVARHLVVFAALLFGFYAIMRYVLLIAVP